MSGRCRVTLLALGALVIATRAPAQEPIDRAMHHLGTPGSPEWSQFANDRPEGKTLEVRFPAKANDREATLLVRQRDVKLEWPVKLNGRSVGKLFLSEDDLVHTVSLPPGALRDGENVLAIGPPSGNDDIVVGELVLDPRPTEPAIARATIAVHVKETSTGRDLPCRITIVDAGGSLTPLFAAADRRLAVRPGVAYTADGRVRLGVRPGRYTVYATRGFEYGLARREITVKEGDDQAIELSIAREVPTPGLVACDTHIHTLTHSGHGDATLEERLVTLAGEGIELPIATDHDRLIDYRDTMTKLGLQSELTPVVGDEVTTRKGHFNAFPFALGATTPDPKIEDWPRLFREIRARPGPGPRVIILNHPRGLHANYRPFDPEHFDASTGALKTGTGFDAMEVINSGAMQSDPMLLFRDWFALWNHGTRVTAVASSDCHDVSRFIVGQGRTYIACRDDEPGRIDVVEACRGVLEGRAVVSLGLLVRLSVDDRFGPGDLVTPAGEKLRVSATVLGPSWTRADRVELFANGVKVREERVDAPESAVEKARVTWTLPRPSADTALVAIASGPGITAPYWPLARPYQPSSKDWEPRVLGATNPVRIDGDGDGRFGKAGAE